MNINPFDGLVVFREVVEANGFTAAAHRLGHSTSHVSKVMARLEQRLGARLLNRTTRTISLTETGRLYYQHARTLIDDARQMEDRILSAIDRPSGLLRISVPVSFNQSHLIPLLPQFLDANPDVRLHVEASDRIVDVVAEGFDVVVRAGHLDDADLIARKLMSSRLLTVASPEYLRKQGTPETPKDLAGHALIDFSLRKIAGIWDYRSDAGKVVSVAVSPRVISNSAETETALAVAGTGITRLPSMACEAQLASGELVPILPEFEEPPIGIYALYPSKMHIAAKVRAFVDFLGSNLARHTV